MNESIGWLLVSVLIFSSVIHCAKCRCAERNKYKKKVDDDGESRNTSTHNQKGIYLLCLYDLSRTCTPNHNMFKEMKAPNEHNECENRSIKRVEWDSFTKSQSYQKKKRERKEYACMCIFLFVFLLINFFFINIKSID